MPPRRRSVARILFAVGDGAPWAASLGLGTWMCSAFKETRATGSALLVVIVVADVARWVVTSQLIVIARRAASIVYTGLRNGKKMHEDLFVEGDDRDHRPSHPTISHLAVPPLNSRALRATARTVGPSAALRDLIKRHVKQRTHRRAKTTTT